MRLAQIRGTPWQLSAPPFDSIEDSLEYIGLLCDTIETSKRSVEAQAVAAQAEGAARRLEAIQLVAYKLDRLAWHVDGSRRILNDLTHPPAATPR